MNNPGQHCGGLRRICAALLSSISGPRAQHLSSSCCSSSGCSQAALLPRPGRHRLSVQASATEQIAEIQRGEDGYTESRPRPGLLWGNILSLRCLRGCKEGRRRLKREIFSKHTCFLKTFGLGRKRFLIFLCTHDDVADRRRRGVTRGIMGPEPG